MENGIDEMLTEHNAQTDVVETQKEEDLSDKTLAEVAYDHNSEEVKSEIQKEIEKEAAENVSIPEPIIQEEKTEEVVEQKSDETIIEEKKEEDVKEVVDEIMEEDDKEVQKKQWEELLTALRDKVLHLERVEKEKEIENKALEKRIEELIAENKDLKYSWAVKLDDEMSYELHLKTKIKSDPKDTVSLKQLSTYHMKQISAIYPEFDIKESFDAIETKRKNAILALSSGSETATKVKTEEPKDPFKQALAKWAYAPRK